ncbi:TetR/AcrR family transcriptional regulator [Alicyclobacillus macrosporangiidus]|uniref:TetR/AcrR family transcriptional regulator n=1 Tax=Alicyclobacillus macrosporangiidus TaxID=392015 RepID=UPI000496C41A|nr:TetR/AcrR family transcriptional regulator [Alicyclobacillus macrosporangiidus]
MSAKARLDRVSVVLTAASLADEIGFEHVTLAAVASRLGVRIPSLYNHVDGLPGLRRELALYGIRELNKRLQLAAIGKESERAIEAMFHAYRAFARERPGLYEATLHAPDPQDRELEKAAQDIVETVLTVLEPFHFTHEDAIHVVRGIRSVAHGFASLEAAGGFGLSIDPDESYRRLISVFLLGLHSIRQVDEN